jgi:glutamate/tyrosine decarboxylase-like PLP-dependent enzyme
MTKESELLRFAAEMALEYASSIDSRAATPSGAAIDALATFDEALPDEPNDPSETLALLNRFGSPATMGSTAQNYFGFVNGATLPVALGASFIVNTWDQNAALPAMSPVAAKILDVGSAWLVDLLGLPEQSETVYVTGATVANASCLAAARDATLAEDGWDVQRDGLFGAPEINVVVGENAHSTLSKSLGLVGLGRERVTIVPSDDQGRMRADLLPDLEGPVIVCAQAGEVNTGAFDPFDEIADWLSKRTGWMHVDGAFGLWALADPTRTDLVKGLTRADSWATDAHKWLNVTYDCGIAFVRRPGALRRTFSAAAGYLPPDDRFEAAHHSPQFSQRARQIEVWSVLRTLGRSGIAELVQQACVAADTIADRLRGAGFNVLNEVVLNQALVRLNDADTTERLIDAIQQDGRIWCGATQWNGATAMRISVSSWKTTIDDAIAAADIMIECAATVEGGE